MTKRLSDYVALRQFDTRHTLELRKKNATPNHENMTIADEENYIVISKDSDFLENYFLKVSLKKSRIVSAGNINNQQLIDFFAPRRVKSHSLPGVQPGIIFFNFSAS